MDEGVFIAVLVIILGLIGGLYFVISRMEQTVLGFASEARGREGNNLTNYQRLANALNELTDELTVLTDALKTERILLTHADATERVAAKKASRAPTPPPCDDRKTRETSPPPEAVEVPLAPAKPAIDEPPSTPEDRASVGEATCVMHESELPQPDAAEPLPPHRPLYLAIPPPPHTAGPA